LVFTDCKLLHIVIEGVEGVAGVGLFIIFSVNQARILENLGAWNMSLTEDEFAALEAALTQIPVHGHRGFVEQQGSSMANWNRK